MKVKLCEVGEIITGNTPSKQIQEYWDRKDVCFVKPDILDDSGITDITGATEYISETARNRARIVGKNAIFVSCIGSIGKIGVVCVDECAFNQQINAVIPNLGINYKYLAYAIQHARPRLMEAANAPVVPIINKSQFGNFEVEVVKDIDIQNQIVKILDKIKSVIVFRQRQLQKLDELVKARFVELFGDMFLNTMAWDAQQLESIADIVSGITKGRKVKEKYLTEVPYMAVSNVKDGYINWATVKTIEATGQEIEQYRLLPDDVLMTEGGDPDKLGRGAIIRNPPDNCIHQNHIFRVRLNEESVLPEYFAEYLQHQRAKRYFLRCAKQTTGIASINMKQLKALPVLVPPIELQNQFSTFVAQVDKSKVAVQAQTDYL